MATIFGLLAVTGMRISEALALDREDVDLHEGVLRIRRTKFGKSRLVAVHETTRQASPIMPARGIGWCVGLRLRPSSSTKEAAA